jgi:hypothetical protein
MWDAADDAAAKPDAPVRYVFGGGPEVPQGDPNESKAIVDFGGIFGGVDMGEENRVARFRGERDESVGHFEFDCLTEKASRK